MCGNCLCVLAWMNSLSAALAAGSRTSRAGGWLMAGDATASLMSVCQGLSVPQGLCEVVVSVY